MLSLIISYLVYSFKVKRVLNIFYLDDTHLHFFHLPPRLSHTPLAYKPCFWVCELIQDYVCHYWFTTVLRMLGVSLVNI